MSCFRNLWFETENNGYNEINITSLCMHSHVLEAWLYIIVVILSVIIFVNFVLLTIHTMIWITSSEEMLLLFCSINFISSKASDLFKQFDIVAHLMGWLFTHSSFGNHNVEFNIRPHKPVRGASVGRIQMGMTKLIYL